MAAKNKNQVELPQHNAIFLAFFTFVTFNLYGVFWLYEVARGFRAAKLDLPPFWHVVPVLLVLPLPYVARAASGYHGMSLGDTLNVTVNATPLAIGFTIYALVALVLAARWFWKLSQCIGLITRNEMSAVKSMLLLSATTIIGIPAIWVGFVQSFINKAAK